MSRRGRPRKKTGPSSKRARQEAAEADRQAPNRRGPRAGRQGAESTPTAIVHLGWRRILLLALGAGIWTGLVEEVPILLAPYGHVVVHVGRDSLWMTPLGDVLYFLVAAAVLLGLARRWPGATTRGTVVGVFAGLATLCLGLVAEKIYPLAVLALAIGVGVQVRRMVGGPPRHPRWAVVTAVLGLLAVGGLTARLKWGDWVWRRYWMASLPLPTATAPNVLLLILDTVRGTSLDFIDPTGAGGDFPPVHTPVLDSLAPSSVLFTRAIAPSPWTLPSHASMFTGAWPSTLWGRSRLGAEWMQGLDGRHPTVAEALDRHGYVTGGFVGNIIFASATTGLGRGFLDYQDYPVSLGQTVLSTALGRRIGASSLLRRVTGWRGLINRKDARTVTDEFLGWERRAEREGRPWFAFVNYFDAHEPYFPPDSVKRTMPPGSRWDDYVYFGGLLTGSGALRRDKWAMDPAERRAHAAGYDAGILKIDTQVGRLLRELERRGVLENTVVVIASDHGEQLGEHGLYDHANSLYTQTLHVPLLVMDPRPGRQPRARVGEVVTLRDVGATLLDLAGVNAAQEGIGGRSLARFWTQEDSTGPGPTDVTAPDTIFSSLDRGTDNQPWYPVSWGASMYSLMDSTYHYVRNGDGTEELYDALRDPAEVHDLAGTAESQPVLARFRTMLGALVQTPPPVPTGPVLHAKPPDPGKVR
ncbi:MAG: sulfatase [Gemmatimonadetes bacterium]|nr:sulfatase [Gemmatimonadota bacterium]